MWTRFLIIAQTDAQVKPVGKLSIILRHLFKLLAWLKGNWNVIEKVVKIHAILVIYSVEKQGFICTHNL